MAVDLTGLVNTGISAVIGLVGGLFKSKTKATIKDLDAKANYAAALDQKNTATIRVIVVLAVILVGAVVFFIFKRRRK